MSANRRRKSAARLHAVQALFQMEAAGHGADRVMREFEEYRFGEELDQGQLEEPDPAHFKAVIDTAVDRQAMIDQLTDRALVAKWPITRIDPTLRALFRAAGAELVGKMAPPRVVISEYVDVARAFYPEGEEPRFANAVIDHMAHELHPEGL